MNLFGLQEIRPEVDDVLNRVETLWKLNNGIMPRPLPDKPIWLRSDEALYLQTNATYLRQLKKSMSEVEGMLYITNTRFEFISETNN